MSVAGSREAIEVRYCLSNFWLTCQVIEPAVSSALTTSMGFAAETPDLEPVQLDLARYEVTVGGRRVHLERQPMELLVLLAGRRGEMVTREEIAQRLWSGEVSLNAEQGINNGIRKIRFALN